MTIETDNLKSLSSGNSDSIDNFIDGRAKAYARVSQSTNTLEGEFNVSSYTDLDVGEGTFNLTNSFSTDSSHVVFATGRRDSGGSCLGFRFGASSASSAQLLYTDEAGSRFDTTEAAYLGHGTLA